MANNITKSQKIVNGALSTFTDAMKKVEEANLLIEKDYVADNLKIEAKQKLIDRTNEEIKELQEKQVEKEALIRQNNKLKGNLQMFIEGEIA